MTKLKRYSKSDEPSTSFSNFGPLLSLLSYLFYFCFLVLDGRTDSCSLIVWTVWEKEGEKNRQEGIAQQLAERKAVAEAAEARRLEIKSQST